MTRQSIPFSPSPLRTPTRSVCRFGFVQVGKGPPILAESRATRKLGIGVKGTSLFRASVTPRPFPARVQMTDYLGTIGKGYADLRDLPLVGGT
jgi:hypothetical protein